MQNKDSTFLLMAYVVAASSKDPSTKIGAVIVGPDNEVRSTGYNGFPRGCDDDKEERYQAPEKYTWFEHAERNAIYNAARIGVSTKDCIIYTQGLPCADCARAIINAGVKKVVIHKDFGGNDRAQWSDSLNKSAMMLAECDVEVVEWEGELIEPVKFLQGKTTSLWTSEL